MSSPAEAAQAAAKPPQQAPAESHGTLSVSAAPGRLHTAYEVGKAVGKGGYAVVYKGVRREDGRIIAVKKVEIFEMTQKKRERCLQEVTLLQQLNHPYIIQMLDAFIDENMLIIIFEWAPAGDLKRMIKKTAEAGKTFDETSIWNFFFQITDALRYMHQHRIMHRDIKPANVLVGANGALKIGDLGLGRQLSEHTMEAFSKVGTPYYVSPEVVRGAGYDWKSDVWSLGCLLYELACLHSPFEMEGANLYDVFQKISKGEYQRLPGDTFSAPLRSLVERMLSVDPVQRPELEEVWGITQRVIQQTQTKTRTDVHSTAEELHSQLMLLEADVMYKAGRSNGKRIELPHPPVEALRQLHPLFFAEPLVQPSSQSADAEQKRQVGAFMAIASWLLRLAGKPEQAAQVEGHLEAVPAPAGLRRRGYDADGVSPPSGRGPKPPSIKRTDSGSGSQRVRVSRWGATADVPGANGSPATPPAVTALAASGSSSRAQSPSSPMRRPTSGSTQTPTPPSGPPGSRVTIPSCSNLLKGAEAVKKAAQAVGLSTEFAPVNAVATGHGRAVCALLQGLLDVAWAKITPAARKPKYHEDAPAASEEEAHIPEAMDGAGDGDGDDVIDADHPLVAGSSGSGRNGQDEDEEDSDAYFGNDGIVRAVGGAGALLSADGSTSRGRGSGVTGSGAAGRGSGPGRPAPVLRAAVDPVAWRNEADRLAPVLGRITIPLGSGGADGWADWHRRWGEFKTSAATVTALSPDAATVLSKAGGTVESDLDRIATSERRLNGNAESLLQQYRAAQQRLQATQRHVVSQEELQQAGNAALAELSTRLQEVSGQMQDKAGGLDSGVQIQGIQAAIRKLRLELKQMELRIGVVHQQLLSKERKRLVHITGSLSAENSQDDM